MVFLQKETIEVNSRRTRPVATRHNHKQHICAFSLSYHVYMTPRIRIDYLLFRPDELATNSNYHATDHIHKLSPQFSSYIHDFSDIFPGQCLAGRVVWLAGLEQAGASVGSKKLDMGVLLFLGDLITYGKRWDHFCFLPSFHSSRFLFISKFGNAETRAYGYRRGWICLMIFAVLLSLFLSDEYLYNFNSVDKTRYTRRIRSFTIIKAPLRPISP